MTIIYLWLLAGVVLVLAELHFAGIGLFFLGLGAIATGAALHLQLVGEQDYIRQFLLFFISTGVLAVLLWKPLQRFRRPSPGFNNIVGETAYVGSNGLTKQKGGEATWSGTIMKAQLIADAPVDRLDAGAQVVVVAIKGATLIVKPKD